MSEEADDLNYDIRPVIEDDSEYLVADGGCHVGEDNQLAIRIDNPNYSSRWYPGAGIYRNVWLIKTHPIHIGQWGTYITTSEVSSASAMVDLEISVNNDSKSVVEVTIETEIFELDSLGVKGEKNIVSDGTIYFMNLEN